jgi:outer membrane protein assembly factor BamB
MPTSRTVGQIIRSGALSAAILASTATASAQWLQWGGPNRDFTCSATGLAAQWPADGPRKLWSRDIGPGHSAIVVDGDTLYTMCRRDDKDAVLALRTATGEPVWETTYDAPPKEGMLLDYGPGPHATPLVVGDRLFTIGGLVHLTALDKKTGKILWQHDLMAEYGAGHLQRGYGASPVAYRDLVIVNVGGKDFGVAAFKQDSGEIAWKSEPFRGGYPTPLLTKINNEDHLILTLAMDRAALDPATGQTRWKTTVDKQLAGIMSTPLFIAPDRVLFSSAYGGATQLYRITHKDDAYTAELLWTNEKMKVMHGTIVRSGDLIVGSSGDFGPAFLMGLHLDTGKIAWRDRTFAKTNLLLADGKLILLDETGLLALATVTPDGLKIVSQAQVLADKSWTVPTLVGTRLYLRDNKTILALDLAPAG